jgi:hypothetical protein
MEGELQQYLLPPPAGTFNKLRTHPGTIENEVDAIHNLRQDTLDADDSDSHFPLTHLVEDSLSLSMEVQQETMAQMAALQAQVAQLVILMEKLPANSY